MTYKPEMEIGPKSPGVWKELRRLEANEEMLVQTAKNRKREVERLRALLYRATAPTASLQEAEDREAAIREGYELTRPRAALAKEEAETNCGCDGDHANPYTGCGLAKEEA